MKNTKISWCDHTLNLWWGCTKVNAACKNCYAEKISKRFGNDIWGDYNPRLLINSAFRNLKKFQKEAEKENKKVTVFVGSMMDIFEEPKDIIEEIGAEIYIDTEIVRDSLFLNITDEIYPNIIFLFLTKRPENINKSIPFEWRNNPPENVWIGVSIFNEESAKQMRESLMHSWWNGKKFYSIEPQLEPINKLNLKGIDWVIQGGESGYNRRPFKLEWANTMREICKEQNVPYFFKQIDGKTSIPKDMNIKEFPKF